VPISNARQSLADVPLYGRCPDAFIRVVVDGVLEVREIDIGRRPGGLTRMTRRNHDEPHFRWPGHAR